MTQQKAARAKATKEAKAAGKQGKELWMAVQAAVTLTEQQKADQRRLQKAFSDLHRELREKLIKLLTPEQRKAVREKIEKQRGRK